MQYKPPLPKRKSAGQTPSYSPVAGSAVILQNSNFSKTYSVKENHSPGIPTVPHPGKQSAGRSTVRDSTVRRNVTDHESSGYGRPSQQQSGWTPGKITADPEVSKRTAFSRVPGRDHRIREEEEDNETRQLATAKPPPHRDAAVKATSHHLSYNSSRKTQRKDPTPNRLFVALDYSDHSSDDGSGILDINPHSSKSTGTSAVASSSMSNEQMKGRSKPRRNSGNFLHREMPSASDEHLYWYCPPPGEINPYI